MGDLLAYFSCTPADGVYWFQTNHLEHESDDRADNRVTSTCVTIEKYMALDQYCHCIVV